MVDVINQEVDNISNFDYPSKIVKINIISRNISYPVLIPINEVFRIEEIFKEHTYSINQLSKQEKPLNIIDVGANIGLFAIYMKCLNPENVIHCFEPSPSTFLLLKKNVGHIPGIHIYPYGLFNKAGEVTMYLDKDNTGENSIKINSSQPSQGKKPVIIYLKEANTELDRLNISSVDILKIDTEGCEVEVLENISMLLDTIDYILLEYHSEKDRRIIDNIMKGFHIVTAKATSFDLGQVKYINSQLIPRLLPKGFNPILPMVKIRKPFQVKLIEFSKRYSYTLYNALSSRP
jgi:FkbM family methyltransferase